MVLKKSLSFLPANLGGEEYLKQHYLSESILLQENESGKNYKEIIRLVIGSVYFLTLVSAIAVLMF
jgi:hypothetical protein